MMVPPAGICTQMRLGGPAPALFTYKLAGSSKCWVWSDCKQEVQALTVTVMVALSVKSTSSDTMRCRAFAASGAADEYRSGFLEARRDSFLPSAATGYLNL